MFLVTETPPLVYTRQITKHASVDLLTKLLNGLPFKLDIILEDPEETRGDILVGWLYRNDVTLSEERRCLEAKITIDANHPHIELIKKSIHAGSITIAVDEPDEDGDCSLDGELYALLRPNVGTSTMVFDMELDASLIRKLDNKIELLSEICIAVGDGEYAGNAFAFHIPRLEEDKERGIYLARGTIPFFTALSTDVNKYAVVSHPSKVKLTKVSILQIERILEKEATEKSHVGQ